MCMSHGVQHGWLSTNTRRFGTDSRKMPNKKIFQHLKGSCLHGSQSSRDHTVVVLYFIAIIFVFLLQVRLRDIIYTFAKEGKEQQFEFF